jgi:NAD(P)-dependent dehydrogenase (short-subunit alcohol dehydrogenase family)
MGRVQGKVAFISGAARGQGRSHAVRLAEEGADIIAVDICHDVESLKYSLATPDDLKETVRLVEAQGRRIVSVQADVREREQLSAAVAQGVDALGRLDIVVAQAGIAAMKGDPPMQAALPHLTEGASVIATGSTAAFMAMPAPQPVGVDPGGVGYMVAKRMLAQYMHELARNLAPRNIRVNVLHPTNVNTDMLHSEPMYRSFRPDLENPTRRDAEMAFPVQQAMPVPWIEPVDVSNAVLFLASDEARFITGMQLRVDAGGYLKWHDFHI